MKPMKFGTAAKKSMMLQRSCLLRASRLLRPPSETKAEQAMEMKINSIATKENIVASV